jgi:hypothetical protein
MAEWLNTGFSVYGLQFQNWAIVAIGIMLLFLLYGLARNSTS